MDGRDFICAVPGVCVRDGPDREVHRTRLLRFSQLNKKEQFKKIKKKKEKLASPRLLTSVEDNPSILGEFHDSLLRPLAVWH